MEKADPQKKSIWVELNNQNLIKTELFTNFLPEPNYFNCKFSKIEKFGNFGRFNKIREISSKKDRKLAKTPRKESLRIPNIFYHFAQIGQNKK